MALLGRVAGGGSGVKIVPMPFPPLNDVPARLRHLADKLETQGTEAHWRALVIVQDRNDGTTSYCFGDIPNTTTALGMLVIAEHGLIDPDLEMPDDHAG